jgi:hypothetical protein
MPSLPPFNGVAVPSCAGIHADGTTIRAINARSIDGKSLPITTSTGEHDIFSSHLCNHGEEYCPTAVPLMLLAPAILSYCLTAPFSDAITENSWPQNSWAKISQKLAQIEAMLARTSMEPLSHSPPPPHCGGSTTPSACDLPSARANPPDRLAKGLMAPLPATTEAAMSLPSLAHPSTPAWSYPSHPHQTMGGIPERLMAPLPATTEAATPSPSSAHPFLPTWSSPTHPLPTMWGGAPPWRHAMLWNAVNSIWHSPCLNAQDLLMQIHG